MPVSELVLAVFFAPRTAAMISAGAVEGLRAPVWFAMLFAVSYCFIQ